MPGIFELCAEAQRAGYLLIVVTNQAGIARGYYSVEEFLVYTRWVHEQFAVEGVPLAATYYCPHHANFTSVCQCRKPEPGMLLSAISFFEIDVGKSILVGDKQSDIKAGIAAGLRRCHLINVIDSGFPVYLGDMNT